MTLHQDTHGDDNSEKAFPRSWDLQAHASSLGFDWPDISGVLDKVAEELQEIRDDIAADRYEAARDELGDLFFAAVNLARFLGIRPGIALERTNCRFAERFEAMRNLLENEGKNMQSCSLEELDAFWERVKVRERQRLEKGS